MFMYDKRKWVSIGFVPVTLVQRIGYYMLSVYYCCGFCYGLQFVLDVHQGRYYDLCVAKGLKLLE